MQGYFWKQEKSLSFLTAFIYLKIAVYLYLRYLWLSTVKLVWGFKAVKYGENILSFIIGTVWHLTIYLPENINLTIYNLKMWK